MKKDWPPKLCQLLTDCWRAVHTERPEFADILPTLRQLHCDALAAAPTGQKPASRLTDT